MDAQSKGIPASFTEAQESIELQVDGEWSVAEFESLLGATKKIYNVGLAAYLASGGEVELSVDVAESEHQAIRVDVEPLGASESGRLTMEGSTYEVADAVSAAIHRIAPMQRGFSPRLRHFPILQGQEAESFRLKLLENDLLTLAPEAQLRIERIAIASLGALVLKGLGEPIRQLGKLIERLALIPHTIREGKNDEEKAKRKNKTAAALDEVKIAHERMKVIEDYFKLLWGENFRSIPGIANQIQDVMSGVRDISDLIQSGRLLPPPAGDSV